MVTPVGTPDFGAIVLPVLATIEEEIKHLTDEEAGPLQVLTD
jgi:hypothetical protein